MVRAAVLAALDRPTEAERAKMFWDEAQELAQKHGLRISGVINVHDDPDADRESITTLCGDGGGPCPDFE